MQEVAIKELKEKIEAIRSDAEEKIASLKFAISILEGDNTPKSKPMTFSIKGQKGSDELYNFGRLSVEERGERILSITRGTGSFLHVNVIAKEIVGYDADEKYYKKVYNIKVGDQPYIQLGGYLLWQDQYPQYTSNDVLYFYKKLCDKNKSTIY